MAAAAAEVQAGVAAEAKPDGGAITSGDVSGVLGASDVSSVSGGGLGDDGDGQARTIEAGLEEVQGVQGVQGDLDPDHYLQDTWTLYFHEPSNADWTMASYVRLEQLSSVEGFWQVHEGVRPYLSRGMFFLMREHVFPCWDDPSNIDGGCISIKVLKEDLETFWEEAVSGLLGERLVRYAPGGSASNGASEAWSAVNGISTSPKRFFCICKIWLAEGSPVDKESFRLPPRYHGEPLYRSNAENIQHNHRVMPQTVDVA
jgi:hypothetical protein